jgi:hypothetical protein
MNEDIPPRLPAVKRTTSLALPTVPAFDVLEQDLDNLLKVYEMFAPSIDPSSAYLNWDLPVARRVIAALPVLRKRWAKVDTPATADNVATQVAVLVGCFPNLRNAELRLYSQAVVEDVSAAHPTVYSLTRAARHVRRKCEFLSIAVVLDALDRATRHAARIRYRLGFDFAAALADAEAELPRLVEKVRIADERWAAARKAALTPFALYLANELGLEKLVKNEEPRE